MIPLDHGSARKNSYLIPALCVRRVRSVRSMHCMRSVRGCWGIPERSVFTGTFNSFNALRALRAVLSDLEALCAFFFRSVSWMRRRRCMHVWMHE